MSDIQEQLKDILGNGVGLDIFVAEEAIYLYEVIGNHKDALTQKKYDHLFGVFQSVLASRLILSINKIYEKVGRYPTRSIPAALSLLEQHCENFKIQDRDGLEQKLAELGFDRESLRELCEPQLTQMVIKYLKKGCPSQDDLNALKTHRDKRIAHNEAINDDKLPEILWGEPEKLLEYAKHVMGILGNHYLGSRYEIDGKYELSYDARQTGITLSRLLNEAGIVSKNSEHH
jgi:AbiU2